MYLPNGRMCLNQGATWWPAAGLALQAAGELDRLLRRLTRAQPMAFILLRFAESGPWVRRWRESLRGPSAASGSPPSNKSARS